MLNKTIARVDQFVQRFLQLTTQRRSAIAKRAAFEQMGKIYTAFKQESMRLLFAQTVAYTERLERPLRWGMTLGCIASEKGNTELDKNVTKAKQSFRR